MTTPIYPRLERAFKQAYLIPLTILRYGSVRPKRARLHGSNNWIYIDPADSCALKKVVHEPLRGKVSTNLIFWRELLTHLQPDLAVDVGVNYGECLFGVDYPPKTRLFGFEANPRLAPYLEQSRQQHPNGQQMVITNCLVSDVLAEHVPFLVNPVWSGQSSAVREINPGTESLEFKLFARPLDTVILPTLKNESVLLFKMDIEGYESRALRGFQQTLSQMKQAVGIIEFTSRFIRWAGEDPAVFFDWMRERFVIYRLTDVKRRYVMEVPAYGALPFKHDDPQCADADLILVSHDANRGWLPKDWTVLNSSKSAPRPAPL
jgi:FkbM family methyltransferase